MGPPVLFRQWRPGRFGRPFKLVKFRSLLPEVDEAGQPRAVGARVTTLGSLLRRTSIDELPELWNVLRGEMSLVGPRPLMMEYLPHYSAEQARRHDVRPGVTGLAQVSGRHRLGWDERFRLDVWYVDHRTLRLDLRILAMTVRELLSGSACPPADLDEARFKGSSSEGPGGAESASMP
jgi:lipopolysaccharide/colanic/teichoic acid biosynthesis glycosyltransferase